MKNTETMTSYPLNMRNELTRKGATWFRKCTKFSKKCAFIISSSMSISIIIHVHFDRAELLAIGS
jgi:hypothetical protein